MDETVFDRVMFRAGSAAYSNTSNPVYTILASLVSTLVNFL